MIKIFPTHSIKAIDAATMERDNISSIRLMEQAATAITRKITELWEDKQTPFTIFGTATMEETLLP